MLEADRHRTAPGQHKAGFHRLARLLALLAMLLNQPLGAIHAACDEEHLSHGAVQLAEPVSSTHHDEGHRHDVPPHPDNVHYLTCQVCLLGGSALPPIASDEIALASAWHQASGPTASHEIRTQKRPRRGDPVRAPPRVHLI